MSSLKLYGSTSGYVEIVPEATAGNNSVTLPNTVGSIAVKDASGNIEVGTGVTVAAPSSDTFTISTNGSERVRVDSSGRLAIGTTSPNELVELKKDQDANTRLRITNASDTASATAGIHLAPYGGNWYIEALRSSTFANPLRFTFEGSEKARITSDGKLLVGTSSARSNFFNSTVSQTVQIESSGIPGAGLALISNPGAIAGASATIILSKTRSSTVGGTTAVSSGDGLGVLSWQGSDGTEFVEAARIFTEVDGTPGANDMPGRLVFSTTKDGSSSPTLRLNINNEGAHGIVCESTTDCLYVSNAAAAGTTRSLIRGRHSATVGTAYSGTESFLVYTNGNVQNTNNSYAGISDIKLKENIVDASSQWDDIKRLQVRKYNFKEQTGQQTHTQIGLVAQEVELVSPGLVNESPDRDAEGNDLGTVTKSVNYSVLYMKAVKALQEAMERIETLEAKVAALEA